MKIIQSQHRETTCAEQVVACCDTRTLAKLALLKVAGEMDMEVAEDNFTSINRRNELLKAPTRKRKPACNVRRERRVVKMTWDMDQDSTSAMLEDMGVSQLEDLEEDEGCETGPKPTPPIPTQLDELVPPGAPKVIVNRNRFLNSSYTGCTAQTLFQPFAYIEPQGATDSTLIFKRHRTEILDGHNHWEKLSDEIFLSVLNWLPKATLVKCARVCKRWNRLTLDETLWRRLELANRNLKSGVVGRVVDRGAVILRLAKSEVHSPIFTENNHIFNQPRFCKVQYLDLSMAVIKTDALEQLLSSCHMLRKLSLENCELNDQICRYIGQNRNLEVLNLCMCQGITENGLVPICNNLQRLDAVNMGWTNMSRGAVVYMVTCLPTTLSKLNLSGCRETLWDEDIQQMCGTCPHLKELDLSDSTLLSGQSIQSIANSLKGLEYIALSRCYHIMPSTLPYLGCIPTLLALDVFGMLKETALIQLRHALKNIEINKFPFSSIARPTTGIRRTSIWGLRVRDSVV